MDILEFMQATSWQFLSFFWSVFSFWFLWQVCDYCLFRLKKWRAANEEKACQTAKRLYNDES